MEELIMKTGVGMERAARLVARGVNELNQHSRKIWKKVLQKNANYNEAEAERALGIAESRGVQFTD